MGEGGAAPLTGPVVTQTSLPAVSILPSGAEGPEGA